MDTPKAEQLKVEEADKKTKNDHFFDILQKEDEDEENQEQYQKS